MKTTTDNKAFDQFPPTPRTTAPTTEKVTSAAHAVIDNTAEKAEAIERDLRSKAADAADRATQTQDAAQQRLNSSLEQARSFAQERPVAAAGIAFAAGVLATTLLRK